MSNHTYQFTKEQSRDEAVKNGRKGGIASGISRRKKKQLKEAAIILLSLPIVEKERLRRMLEMGVPFEDCDNQMAIIAGLTEMAINGDPRSAKVLFGLLGEKPDDDGAGVVIIDDIP